MTIEEQAQDAMAELEHLTKVYAYTLKRQGHLMAQLVEFDGMVTQLKDSVVTLTQERDALQLENNKEFADYKKRVEKIAGLENDGNIATLLRLEFGPREEPPAPKKEEPKPEKKKVK